jgi:hypothetical protein
VGLALKNETLEGFTSAGDVQLAMCTTVQAGGETIHDDVLTIRRGSITATVLTMDVRPGSEPSSLQTLYDILDAHIVETLQVE